MISSSSSLIWSHDKSSLTVACPVLLQKDKLQDIRWKSIVREDWLPIKLHLHVIHLLVRKVCHFLWESVSHFKLRNYRISSREIYILHYHHHTSCNVIQSVPKRLKRALIFYLLDISRQCKLHKYTKSGKKKKICSWKIR